MAFQQHDPQSGVPSSSAPSAPALPMARLAGAGCCMLASCQQPVSSGQELCACWGSNSVVAEARCREGKGLCPMACRCGPKPGSGVGSWKRRCEFWCPSLMPTGDLCRLCAQVAPPDALDPRPPRPASHKQPAPHANGKPQQQGSHPSAAAGPASQNGAGNGVHHSEQPGSESSEASSSGSEAEAGNESEEEGQCAGVPPAVAAEQVSPAVLPDWVLLMTKAACRCACCWSWRAVAASRWDSPAVLSDIGILEMLWQD